MIMDFVLDINAQKIGHLNDVKIVSLVIKPEILRGSHFFLLCKAIEYQTKQTCLRANRTYIFLIRQ